MCISFLLARRFKGKVYVFLMTVVLILLSLFSIAFPSVWGTFGEGITFWQANLPTIPLSFPFHASISKQYMILFRILFPELIRPYPNPPAYFIRIYFLTNQFWTNEKLTPLYFLTSELVILLISFFLLINLVGAMLGYWISKTTFLEKLLTRRKNKVKRA